MNAIVHGCKNSTARTAAPRFAPLLFAFTALLLDACAAHAPNSFDIERYVAARVHDADCGQLRENMVEALADRETASDVATAAEVAGIASTALSFVPFGNIAAPLIAGGASLAQGDDMYGAAEAEQLYRASHQVYQDMDCQPAVVFGS